MTGLLDTRQVAERLLVSEAFVRDHAAELGGMRLGGRRGPLRFDERGLQAYLDRCRLERESPRARMRPGRARQVAGVDLLPIPAR